MQRAAGAALWVLMAMATAHAGEAPMTWQPGDAGVVVRPVGPFTAAQLMKQAADGGLRWVVVCNPVPGRTLLRPELGETLTELATDTLTPIHTVRWQSPRPISEDIIGLGVAPDLPLPEARAQGVINWVNALGGAAILASPGRKLAKYAEQLHAFSAFEAFHNGRWNPECELGGAWDQLLQRGLRVGIVAGSTDVDRPVLGKGAGATYVLAPGTSERDVLEAVRAGRTIVAERDRIRMTFTVNGQAPGGIAVPEDRQVEVHISVEAEEPVDEVLIIGNLRVFADRVLEKTAVLHTLRLDAAKAERRFTLKLSEATTYLRAVAVIHKGACRTMTSAVFLGKNAPQPPEANLAAQNRELAIAALGGADWDRPAAARELVGKLLADPRMGSSVALYLAEATRPETVERLRPLLKDGVPVARALTAFVFARVLGPKSLDALRPMLNDASEQPRLYAAQCFARYAGADDLETLDRMAADPWREVRESALLALARLRNPQTVARLRAALNDLVPAIRATAERHLTEILNIPERERVAFFVALRAGEIQEKQLRAALPREEEQQLVRAALSVKLDTVVPVAPQPVPREESAFPVIAVSPTKQAPAIDGKPTDAVWQQARPTGGFVLESGRPPRHQTTVRALYDAKALYLLIVCDEPETEKMLTSEKERDGNVWLDDSVDIYLSPTIARKGMNPLYYRFSINSAGVKFDEMRRNRRWDAEWEAATSVDKKAWTLEIALPFASLPADTPAPDKTRWLINIVRHRRVRPGEDSYLSRGQTRSLERYAELKFE